MSLGYKVIRNGLLVKYTGVPYRENLWFFDSDIVHEEAIDIDSQVLRQSQEFQPEDYEWEIVSRPLIEYYATEVVITNTDGSSQVLSVDTEIEPNNIVSIQSTQSMTEEELIRYLDTL